MYLTIKTLHVTCAVISICGFSVRGLLKLLRPDLMRARWIKIVPHIVDTLLLGSAIYLATASGQYPLQHPWLTAKICALLTYIGFGFVVLRFAQTQGQRWTAFLLALASFAYIVSVAITRSPTPWI